MTDEWVLVPRNPTWEMVERGTIATLRLQLGKGDDDAWDAARSCWAKMLDAAPKRKAVTARDTAGE